MVIYWHKQDFRLIDNQALNKAIKLSITNSLKFLPIFGLETDLINNPEIEFEFSKLHICAKISAFLPLFENYQYFGVQPVLFKNSVIETLEKINTNNKNNQIKYLITHQEHGTTGTYQRDQKVNNYCKQNNINWVQIPPSSVQRGIIDRDNRTKDFNNYVNSEVLLIPNFKNLDQSLQTFTDTYQIENQKLFKEFLQEKNRIIEKNNFQLKDTNEKSALEELKSFTTYRSSHYRGSISSPNTALEFGSRLSQYLAYGSISLRFVYQYFWQTINNTTDKKIKSGLLATLSRLHWREHFIQRIESEATMVDKSINLEFNNIEYSHKLELFEAFKKGMTGEVLVDACLRCLLQTGFINFRMRAMLLSYSVFGLDLDWRKTGRFLASVFYDYEPGIHWSQIHMQAGITGINTIRVYSPSKQLLDQDMDCKFVRQWIPELQDLTNEQILDYLNLSLAKLTNNQYIDPIVNFKEQSKINKIKTFSLRKESNKGESKKVFVKHGSRRKNLEKNKN